MLVRRLGVLKIAHVLQGPVLSRSEPELLEAVLDQLVRVIRAQKISYLAVQPATNCDAAESFEKWGLQVSPFLVGQRATSVLDLSPELRIIMRRMRRTTRNNVGLAQELGVQVRQGKESDLAGFHRLLMATGERRHFVPESLDYCLKMWRNFAPSQGLKLFLAEYEGELLSGLLAVPFGDTVAMKMLGWSGSKRRLRPNELVVWKAVEWAKESGFLSFDLCGIDASAAIDLVAGKPLPESEESSITRFKLGFGGAVVLVPPTYEYISNAALRVVSRELLTLLGRWDISMTAHRVLSEGFLGREHRWPWHIDHKD